MTNKARIITYAAAASNVGLWVMAGILSEGGQIWPALKIAVVGASALCLGIAMSFGLVEIAGKMSSLPAEFERTRKDGTVKVSPNRRYQVARGVLVAVIGGESFLLMPVVVALATSASLATVLPGAWLWLWAFGRVAASALLLAGLAAVLDAAPQPERRLSQPTPQSKITPAEPATPAPQSAPPAPYTCDRCGAAYGKQTSLAAHRAHCKPKKGHQDGL